MPYNSWSGLALKHLLSKEQKENSYSSIPSFPMPQYYLNPVSKKNRGFLYAWSQVRTTGKALFSSPTVHLMLESCFPSPPRSFLFLSFFLFCRLAACPARPSILPPAPAPLAPRAKRLPCATRPPGPQAFNPSSTASPTAAVPSSPTHWPPRTHHNSLGCFVVLLQTEPWQSAVTSRPVLFCLVLLSGGGCQALSRAEATERETEGWKYMRERYIESRETRGDSGRGG